MNKLNIKEINIPIINGDNLIRFIGILRKIDANYNNLYRLSMNDINKHKDDIIDFFDDYSNIHRTIKSPLDLTSLYLFYKDDIDDCPKWLESILFKANSCNRYMIKFLKKIGIKYGGISIDSLINALDYVTILEDVGEIDFNPKVNNAIKKLFSNNEIPDRLYKKIVLNRNNYYSYDVFNKKILDSIDTLNIGDTLYHNFFNNTIWIDSLKDVNLKNDNLYNNIIIVVSYEPKINDVIVDFDYLNYKNILIKKHGYSKYLIKDGRKLCTIENVLINGYPTYEKESEYKYGKEFTNNIISTLISNNKRDDVDELILSASKKILKNELTLSEFKNTFVKPYSTPIKIEYDNLYVRIGLYLSLYFEQFFDELEYTIHTNVVDKNTLDFYINDYHNTGETLIMTCEFFNYDELYDTVNFKLSTPTINNKFNRQLKNDIRKLTNKINNILSIIFNQEI